MNATEKTCIPEIDKALGCISLVCHLLGTPLNIISFYLFRQQKNSPIFVVYKLITLTDAWLSIGGFPLTLVMIDGTRDLGFFRNYTFVSVWTILWEPSVSFSMFLVMMVTSVSMIKITGRQSGVRMERLVSAIVTYVLFVWTELFVISFFGTFTQSPTEIVPYLLIPDYPALNKSQLILSTLLLALPIIPILIMTGITTVTLVRSAHNHTSSARSASLKMEATWTVITFTVVYIICKLPLVVADIRWIQKIITNFESEFDLLGRPTVYLRCYNWPVAYIILTQISALLNPFIYLVRMSWFRQGARQLVTERRETN